MAGKIPQHFIDDLLERTDIVELIDARVKLKKTGRNYSACCPFHDEKTPSFSVNPDKQFYYCFGCGAGGNAISFLMDYDRSDFVETIENLAHHHGLTVPREESQEDQKQQQAKRSIYDLLEQSNQWYQQQLKSHPLKNKPIDYLKMRGLTGEISKRFGIGYAPPGWDNLLKNIGKTPEQTRLLIEGGMLIEKDDHSGCYDRFRDRLMFPIRDNRGRTIGFGGRVLNDEKPKYLNSPETPVFHKQLELYGLYEARQSNRHLTKLIMVEGYMDVVALAQFGIDYAVATLGTSAGEAHMEKVFRHCSEVIFCFDGDEAGRKAADRALQAVLPMMQAGRQAKFLFLPEGEDPDSLVRSIGKEQFEWHIEKAPSLSEYLFETCSKSLDLNRADDRAKLIDNIMPHIKAIPAGTFQELLLRSLSEKTGLPIEDIKTLEELSETPLSTINEESKNKTSPNEATPTKREKLTREEKQVRKTPARSAIAMLLLSPSLAKNLEFSLPELEGDLEIQLLNSLHQHILQNPDISSASLIGQWLAKEQEAISKLLSWAIEVDTEDKDYDQQIEKELKDAIAQIKTDLDRKKHTEFIEKMKPTPNKNLKDMSAEEKDAFLAIFQQKK